MGACWHCKPEREIRLQHLRKVRHEVSSNSGGNGLSLIGDQTSSIIPEPHEMDMVQPVWCHILCGSRAAPSTVLCTKEERSLAVISFHLILARDIMCSPGPQTGYNCSVCFQYIRNGRHTCVSALCTSYREWTNLTCAIVMLSIRHHYSTWMFDNCSTLKHGSCYTTPTQSQPYNNPPQTVIINLSVSHPVTDKNWKCTTFEYCIHFPLHLPVQYYPQLLSLAQIHSSIIGFPWWNAVSVQL